MAGRDEGTGALVEPRNDCGHRGIAVAIVRPLQSFTQWWVRPTKPHTQKFGHSPDQDEWTRHIAAQSMLTAVSSAHQLPEFAKKTETKSQPQISETPERRLDPDYNTVASVKTIIDDAMRNLVPDWKPSVPPSPGAAAKQPPA